MYVVYWILCVISLIVSVVFPCSLGYVLQTAAYDETVLGIKVFLLSLPFIIAFLFVARYCIRKIKQSIWTLNFADIYRVTFANYDIHCQKIKHKKNSESEGATDNGHFVLQYPHWKFTEQGKDTADVNKINNQVVWEDSTLQIDNYVLKARRPDAILFLVQQLRKNGIPVPACQEEIQKKEQLIKKAQLNYRNKKLDEIIRSCGNDETKFISLCEELLKKLGFVTATVPQEDRVGYDLVIEKGGIITIVACTCHVRGYKEDKKAVMRLMKANQETVPCHMMFMSTGSFNSEAIALANQEQIVLVNGYALLNLLFQNGIVKQANIKGPSKNDCILTPEDLQQYFPEDISLDAA